jgi:hypothetical protein
LWSIFRSPLTIGGDLLHNDEWTISLLTNAEIISIDQHSTGNQPVIVTDNIVIWRSRPEAAPGYYFAIFNRGDAANTVRYAWNELGLASKAYRVRDLWEHKELGTAASLKLTLPPHACVAYRVVEGD